MMKRLIPVVALMCITIFARAEEPVKPLDRKTIETMSPEQKKLRVDLLEERLQVLKKMDFKNLSKAEKKDIKREIKGIKREMKTERISGGVYISATALIVILLLLIILT